METPARLDGAQQLCPHAAPDRLNVSSVHIVLLLSGDIPALVKSNTRLLFRLSLSLHDLHVCLSISKQLS